MYDYRVAAVKRVVDGDTVDLVVDVGFYMTATLRFRILGIDTPERGQDGFREATDHVIEWCRIHEGLMRVQTHKADSFGRWLCVLYSADDPSDTLARSLLDSGHGRQYAGKYLG